MALASLSCIRSIHPRPSRHTYRLQRVCIQRATVWWITVFVAVTRLIASVSAMAQEPTWLVGTSLWTLVEHQGGRAPTFFWPESDAPIAGTLPTDYRLYDGRVPHGKRVAQVVEWLSG